MSTDEERAEAHIELRYLKERDWIGFGAAVEWICMRGRPMTLGQYESRLDDAAEAFVSALVKCSEVESELAVQGVADDDPDSYHKSIPAGIWPNVVVREESYDFYKWNLALVGDQDEWGADLVGPKRSYLDLRITCEFVLQRWKPGTLELDPRKNGDDAFSPSGRTRKSADRGLRLFAVAVFRHLPGHLIPLRQQEFEELVKARFPDATRTKSRLLFQELKPKKWSTKRGPRGPQDSDRARRFRRIPPENDFGAIAELDGGILRLQASLHRLVVKRMQRDPECQRKQLFRLRKPRG